MPTHRMYDFNFFFFNDTATTEIYTLTLHDALPIWAVSRAAPPPNTPDAQRRRRSPQPRSLRLRSLRTCGPQDRKSTRLNSSHANISYAVFCLKKKKAHMT